MPVGPLQTQVYVDPLLSQVSIAYMNESFLADVLFPTLEVKQRTGIYYEYSKDNLRVVSDLRAPGQRANRVEYGLSQKTYGPIIEHALEIVIPDEDREESMAPLDLDRDAVQNLTERLALSKEVDAQTIYSTAGTGYANDATGYLTLSGTTQWSDYANSTPVQNVQSGKDAIKKKIVKPAGTLTLVLGYEVFAKLINHPQILERIKYSQLGVVTTDLLAQVFGVKQVLIAEAEQNTANETATDVLAYIWGKDAYLVYITATPGIKIVTHGYSLRKSYSKQGENQPGIIRQVTRWREEANKADALRVADAYQHKVMAIDALFRFVNAVA